MSDEIDLSEAINEIIETLEDTYQKKISEAKDKPLAELIFLSGLVGAAVQLAIENDLTRKDILKLTFRLYNESVKSKNEAMN